MRQQGPDGAGRAYVFDGALGGLLHTLASPHEQENGHFGHSAAGVPDLNGDGLGEAIVGAIDESRAYIFDGATGHPLRMLISPNDDPSGGFGNSVSAIPDVNGDPFSDVIVGACYEDPGSNPEDSGRAYIFLSDIPTITPFPTATDTPTNTPTYTPTATLTPTYTPTDTATPSVGCVKGDLDDDGNFDLFDVLKAVNIVLDIPPPPTEWERCAGDMDSDGDHDLFDILAVVNLVLET